MVQERQILLTWTLWIIGVVFGGLLVASATAHAKPKEVAVSFDYPPGTIVIVNNERRLYFVKSRTRAIRYRVAVGTKQELWVGRTFVSNKRKNPHWTPVGDGRTVRGGSPDNPLGKRALYLDWSLLRIHGTNARGSIGRAASNGCIRMLNEDVISLYNKVHVGAPVIAINKREDASRFVESKISGKLPAFVRTTRR